MDERYVVYFMTAGTKPPQPAVEYCPRSQDQLSGSFNAAGAEFASAGRGVVWKKVDNRLVAIPSSL